MRATNEIVGEALQLTNASKVAVRPAFRSLFNSQNDRSKVYNRRWEKNVVYLYQLHRQAANLNISPFCFKVETWLRAYQIRHEVRSFWSFRPWEKYFPFVELNGEKIVDSQFIIQRLQEHFSLHDELEGVDEGTARAVDRMIEGSTYYLLLYFKLVENLPRLIEAVEPWPVKRWLTRGLMTSFDNKMQRLFADTGISKLSRNGLIGMLRKDIGAVDVILGDKKFLFGVKPTTPDFTLFGHLATSYYLPFHQPITDILDDEYPRVKRLIERMRQHYYPEWEFKS